MAEWRVGRKLGRTVYRDEVFVGLMETRELAAEIVETMNRVDRLLAEVRAESGRGRSPEPIDCPACLADHYGLPAPVEHNHAPEHCCCAGCIGMGPCDDDLGKSDDDASDDLGPTFGECCGGETGTPGVDCDCSWSIR